MHVANPTTSINSPVASKPLNNSAVAEADFKAANNDLATVVKQFGISSVKQFDLPFRNLTFPSPAGHVR